MLTLNSREYAAAPSDTINPKANHIADVKLLVVKDDDGLERIHSLGVTLSSEVSKVKDISVRVKRCHNG